LIRNHSGRATFLHSNRDNHLNITSSYPLPPHLPTNTLLLQEQFQHGRVIRRSQTSNRVPALRHGKPVGAAARVAADGDVVEDTGVLVLHRLSATHRCVTGGDDDDLRE
jgi:hypothetical protein